MDVGREEAFAHNPPTTGFESKTVGVIPTESMDLAVVRPAGPPPGGVAKWLLKVNGVTL